MINRIKKEYFDGDHKSDERKNIIVVWYKSKLTGIVCSYLETRRGKKLEY